MVLLPILLSFAVLRDIVSTVDYILSVLLMSWWRDIAVEEDLRCWYLN